jgi:hypothetical protein
MASTIKTVAIVAGVAVAAYAAYQIYKKVSPTSAASTYSQLDSIATSANRYKPSLLATYDAGYTDQYGTPKATLTYGDGKTNTTYFFAGGDWDKVSWTQKLLLKLGVSPKAIFE